jgi:predicted ATPase/class 3 adenylate cyclase
VPDAAVTTFLFTDVEGSTRLWEIEPQRMHSAMAMHDALIRSAVEDNRGTIVKMTGDGTHAVFDDPADALIAALRLQRAITDKRATGGIALSVRCGLHAGATERRDGDYFGVVVNRAARLMNAANGGQVLLSHAVASSAANRLPAGLTLRDLGNVRLRDLAMPEHVYQLVHPDLRSEFPALRSLEATPNNLPRQLTSFVGRDTDLREVARLLLGTRLLTLTGTGGLGKTRLSLQVAADAMDGYPDGVWFVELASLRDDALVAQAVAAVVGVKEDAGRPVIEALAKFVRDRRLLVILDNCEHLVRGCASVAKTLLQAGAHVTILASSRESLHVGGEATYAVPALSLPDREPAPAPQRLLQSEAVRLFADRATAAKASFELTASNAVAVASICRKLDGIPLALELAAARVRTMSVEAIDERLADRFRLLTAGDRTVEPRHQTLRALIDWSFDLLSDRERVLLRRLAVFAGGWTIDAAEAVGADGGLEPADVLDVLTGLAEKSLVVPQAESDRYRLLETVREYALERLAESGEGDAVRARHLAFYVALAEQARPKLFGSEQVTWLARLDAELENLLAAHGWCASAVDGPELGLRLAYAIKPYWLNRGLLTLGHRVTDEALRLSPARNVARCRGLTGAGQLSYFMGRYEDARRYLEESLGVARDIGDARTVAAVLQPLGMACLGQGDIDTARRHLEEGFSLARGLGNKREITAATNALAQLHRTLGEPDAAEPLYESALALARDLGDREYVALVMLNLAMVAVARGSTERARSLLVDVHSIGEEIGSKAVGQCMLDVCAGLASYRTEWACAARFFGAAEVQAEHTGLRRDPADEVFVAPLIAKARDGLGAAAFAAAEQSGRGLSYEQAMAAACCWLDGPAPNAPRATP